MTLKLYSTDVRSLLNIPYVGGVKAGFSSPAQDYNKTFFRIIKKSKEMEF